MPQRQYQYNEVLYRLGMISTHGNGVPRRLLRAVGVEILERRQLEVREEPPDGLQLRLCSRNFRPFTRPGRAHILRRHPYEYVARTDITMKHAVLVQQLMSWDNERQRTTQIRLRSFVPSTTSNKARPSSLMSAHSQSGLP